MLLFQIGNWWNNGELINGCELALLEIRRSRQLLFKVGSISWAHLFLECYHWVIAVRIHISLLWVIILRLEKAYKTLILAIIWLWFKVLWLALTGYPPLRSRDTKAHETILGLILVQFFCLDLMLYLFNCYFFCLYSYWIILGFLPLCCALALNRILLNRFRNLYLNLACILSCLDLQKWALLYFPLG